MNRLAEALNLTRQRLDMDRVSLCGRSMAGCRLELIKWIGSNRKQGDSWANYCIKYWLNELGGIGAIW